VVEPSHNYYSVFEIVYNKVSVRTCCGFLKVFTSTLSLRQ